MGWGYFIYVIYSAPVKSVASIVTPLHPPIRSRLENQSNIKLVTAVVYWTRSRVPGLTKFHSNMHEIDEIYQFRLINRSVIRPLIQIYARLTNAQQSSLQEGILPQSGAKWNIVEFDRDFELCVWKE